MTRKLYLVIISIKKSKNSQTVDMEGSRNIVHSTKVVQISLLNICIEKMVICDIM